MNKLLKRILNYPERRKVRALLADPPAVRKNTVVFTSTEDYSDNPRALYEYMIENGYNEKYEITWLFEFGKNYRELDTPNVRSLRMYNGRGQRTAASYEAILSAEYVFFSHNVNWARVFRPEQHFIELWHGCGYKGRQPGEQRVIRFDFCVTTGPKYAKELTTHYLCTPDKLKALGYPRNDWFRTSRTDAAAFADRIRREKHADTLIIWMPTFRKSRVERISTETIIGDTGLPLAGTTAELRELDGYCRERGIVILIKTHVLQAEADIPYDELTNIVLADNEVLKAENVNLYELMAHTDGLLSDYSSVAVDYLLLDRPMGFILTDFDEYEKARSWCYDNVKDYMPGQHIYTADDLKKFLSDTAEGRDGFAEARARVLPELQTELRTADDSYSRHVLDYFGITRQR